MAASELTTPAHPEFVPARMVNEFTYCPRLAYMEWVQGEFADSADTVDGRFQHRRVDRPSGSLPMPEDSADADVPAPRPKGRGRIEGGAPGRSDFPVR